MLWSWDALGGALLRMAGEPPTRASPLGQRSGALSSLQCPLSAQTACSHQVTGEGQQPREVLGVTV